MPSVPKGWAKRVAQTQKPKSNKKKAASKPKTGSGK